MALRHTPQTVNTILGYHALPGVFRLGNLSRLWHQCLQQLTVTMRLTSRAGIRRSDERMEFSLSQWRSCPVSQREYIASHVRRLMLDIHMQCLPMLDLHFGQDLDVLEELIICLVDETGSGQPLLH